MSLIKISEKFVISKLKSIKVPNTYIEGCDICEFSPTLSIHYKCIIVFKSIM